MGIKVTLEFDDIDAAGAALAYIKAAGAIPGMTTGTHTLVNAIGSVPEHRAEQKAKVAIEKAAKVEAPKPVDAPSGATAPAEPAPAEITYADVSTAVLTKMKTDKAAVLAAAAKFGVKNAKELKPEQWADFIKEIA